MELKEKTIKELKTIMARDYGADISESEADDLGKSLLVLTRMVLSRGMENTKLAD